MKGYGQGRIQRNGARGTGKEKAPLLLLVLNGAANWIAVFDDQLVVCARAALIGGRFSHYLTPGTVIVALCLLLPD